MDVINYTAEVWKPIIDFPHYEVSNCGRIRRKFGHRCRKPHVMRAYKTKSGHFRVCLCEKGITRNVFVHRVMALAFLGQPVNGKIMAAHNDGNPANNALANIRWATPAENTADRVSHGTDMRGEAIHQSKLTAAQVRYIKETLRTGYALAKELSVSQSTISAIRTGKWWKHI